MNATRLQQLALLLPALVFFFWLANLERAVWFAETVRLKVAAYDPRDILSGRYLQYRIDYRESSICSNVAAENCFTEDLRGCLPHPNTAWCVCLKRGAEFSEASWNGACSERPSDGCDLYLKGFCSNAVFLSNLERFYIPEWYEQYVRVVPDGASIDVAITASGQGTVREFYVGAQRLEEYVAALAQGSPVERPATTTAQPDLGETDSAAD